MGGDPAPSGLGRPEADDTLMNTIITGIQALLIGGLIYGVTVLCSTDYTWHEAPKQPSEKHWPCPYPCMGKPV
jgi:hypothetical protein